jgi:hypothetical protein
MLANPVDTTYQEGPLQLEYDARGEEVAHGAETEDARGGDKMGEEVGGGDEEEVKDMVNEEGEKCVETTKKPEEEDKHVEKKPDSWEHRLAAFVRTAEGAYSFGLLTREAVFGVRDRHGMRPLCIGRREEEEGRVAWFLSSESCALGTVGASFVREVRHVVPQPCQQLTRSSVDLVEVLPALDSRLHRLSSGMLGCDRV